MHGEMFGMAVSQFLASDVCIIIIVFCATIFVPELAYYFFLQINDDDDGEIVDAIYFRLSLLRFVAC